MKNLISNVLAVIIIVILFTILGANITLMMGQKALLGQLLGGLFGFIVGIFVYMERSWNQSRPWRTNETIFMEAFFSRLQTETMVFITQNSMILNGINIESAFSVTLEYGLDTLRDCGWGDYDEDLFKESFYKVLRRESKMGYNPLHKYWAARDLHQYFRMSTQESVDYRTMPVTPSLVNHAYKLGFSQEELESGVTARGQKLTRAMSKMGVDNTLLAKVGEFYQGGGFVSGSVKDLVRCSDSEHFKTCQSLITYGSRNMNEVPGDIKDMKNGQLLIWGEGEFFNYTTKRGGLKSRAKIRKVSLKDGRVGIYVDRIYGREAGLLSAMKSGELLTMVREFWPEASLILVPGNGLEGKVVVSGYADSVKSYTNSWELAKYAGLKTFWELRSKKGGVYTESTLETLLRISAK